MIVMLAQAGHSRRGRRVERAAIGLSLVLTTALVACSRKLSQQDCDHLLGRGVGLAAFSGSAEVPVDIDMLRGRARREAKTAIADFDKACVGAPDEAQVTCARRANNNAEFVACGGLVKRARDAGEVVQYVIARQHDSDECSKYAEHGVQIGVASVDDARKLVKECDGVMEEGVYRCRLASKDPTAWVACNDP